jgi:hypothetical protein
MRIRTLAGWLVILAATGLAAVSGNLAYHGFETMLSIPFAGWIGPFVAASLIGLGIGAESEIRDRAWLPAIVLLVLLGGAAALDKHSGELALKARVEAAEQANADRKAAYTTAVAEKAAAEKVLADLDAELALLNGSDVKAIQKAIGTVPDGAWGADTAHRVAIRKDQIAAAQSAAQADSRKWAETVAEGAPVAELPFTLKDAELYALLITALSVILAFAGSWIAHPREELEKIAAEMDVLEGNVVAFEKFLDAA